ncbi:MAG TPA: oxidoreductase [Peptococcaceae bacterium]|nr:oxidoreductase [Peptococcaceae bacterium]
MAKVLGLLILGLALVFGFSGCSPGETSPSTGSDLSELTKIEIFEYEGEALNSILDFRENSIKGPQTVDISTYRLQIDGLVEQPAALTYDQVLANKNYSKVVTLHCVEGWSAKILWEGVLLKDLLDGAKVKAEANTVIFYSVDGYTTSLPLQTILEKEMIMAYKINGVVLPAERGYPFQLIAEDKLGYKWIKWINRIELSEDADYKGYWEERGYSNEADVDN